MFLSLASWCIVAVSLVDSAAVNPHPWMAPTGSDVRSPCPGLNSLANHGILPRSGRGLTVAMLNKALLEGYNVGNDFSTVIGATGLAGSPNPLSGSFDLDSLDRHNIFIEHDSSLSRKDIFFGDNHSFDNETWSQVLAFVEGRSTFDIPTGAKAKFARLERQRAINPTLTYTPQQFVLSYGETALYLSVMGDPITGVAPVEYVRSFFEQERLPYELGWQPPTTQTNLLTLGAMVLALNVANGEPVPEGLILGESTLKAAFSALDPITGLVTGILS